MRCPAGTGQMPHADELNPPSNVFELVAKCSVRVAAAWCKGHPHFSLRANRSLNLPQPDKNSVPKDNFRVLRVYDCPGLQSYQNVSRETLLSDWAAKSDKTDAKSITAP